MKVQDFDKEKIEKEPTICPSCGKRVPKLDYCEACGTSFKPEKRVKVKFIFLFIIFIAAIGISMIVYGYVVGNRITPIANIDASMEGESKRIEGTVIGIDYWDTYERTTFLVLGETGYIEVTGWAEFTNDLRISGYPAIGDKVIVEGQVSVYLGQVSLEVSDAEKIITDRQEPIPLNIGNIGLYLWGKKVLVQGNITNVNEYSWGSIITMEDETGEIEVEVSSSQIEFMGGYAQIPQENETIILMGMVSNYYEDVQLIPSYLLYQKIGTGSV
jgi:RecJ-like exonuclease